MEARARCRVWGFRRLYLLVGAVLSLVCIVSSTHLVENCVSNCDCYLATGEVDCSNRGLTEVPNLSEIKLPDDLQLDDFDVLKINLSDNNIEVVKKTDFNDIKQLSGLVHLEIRRNRLRSIEDETFSLNLHLVQLFLGENELQDLPLNVFKDAHFTILDLSYNKFASPPPALSRTSFVGHLKLNNNPMIGLTALSFEGVHGVTTLDLSFCELSLANVDPAAFKASNQLAEMRALFLDGNHFGNGTLDSTFFEHMTDGLIDLHLSDCGITALDRRTFSRLSRVVFLYLNGNNFGEEGLGRHAFRDLRLQILDLSESNITRIRKGAFKDTQVYDVLYLEKNNLLTIFNNSFAFLSGVNELHLSYCNISEIRGSPFVGLADLSRLYLDHNYIDDESMASALGSLPSLHTLHAAFNNLTRVPKVPGDRFPLLTKLYLAENRIAEVQREHLRNMTSLDILDLKKNYHLWRIDEEALAECPYITEFYVEHTQITHLPSFKNASQLQYIYASDSWIESLPDDLCVHSPSLIELVAPDNRISAIPPLSGCRYLVSAVLDHNRISGISAATFAKLTAIKTLKLDYNRIGGLPHGVFKDLVRLEHLHLDRNLIGDLPVGIFDNSSWLAHLDMSHNNIRELRSNIFKNNRVLEYINFDYNNIKRVHRTAFPEKMEHLQHLRLSFNDFDSFHVPPGGFKNLLALGLQDLYGLHQVPSQSDIPNIQELNLTYSYHCCIWKDHVRDDLKGPLDANADTSGDDETFFPTDPPVTLPPSIDPGGIFDDCVSKGDLDQTQLDAIKELAAFFNITFVILPNCKIVFHIANDSLGEPSVPDSSTKPKPILMPWNKIRCSPRPTHLTPCENLMDPWFLRVAIWAIWVLAVLGNATVLFVTIMAREKLEVPQMLICNLAVADFCLGVYLAFLAVVDVRTYGNRSFYQSALDWQLGPGCKTAGWIAVFSSELSVFMLVILTLERLHTIAYTFNQKERRRKRVTILVVIFAWIVAATLATLPLVGINSYTQVALCLPFVTENDQDKAYIGSILSINLLAFLIILTCYSYIFFRIQTSPVAGQNKKEVCSAAVKIAILIVTTFACWFPLAVIGYAALDGKRLVTAGEAKYLVVFVYPLNACVNPFVYAIFTRQFRQRLWSIFKRSRSKMQSFPGPHGLRIQRTIKPEGAGQMRSPRGSNVPPSPEELMRMRRNRRSNSFSVQLVDTNAMKSPTPPATPGSARSGRRASLPALFGSTHFSSQALAASPNSLRATATLAPVGRGGASVSPNYPPPFRLGQQYAPHNSSLPNLVEEQEEMEEEEMCTVAGSIPALSGSQLSNDSGFRRLSVVDEEEPDKVDGEEERYSVSAASTDSEDYSDAQDNVPALVNVFVESPDEPAPRLQAEDLPMVSLRHQTGSLEGSLNDIAAPPLHEHTLSTDSAVHECGGTNVALRNGSRDSGHVTMYSNESTTPRSNSASSCSTDTSSSQEEPTDTVEKQCSIDSHDSFKEHQIVHTSVAAANANSSIQISCESTSRDGVVDSCKSTSLHSPTHGYSHLQASSLDTLRRSSSPTDSHDSSSRVIRIENPNFKSSLSVLSSETEV